MKLEGYLRKVMPKKELVKLYQAILEDIFEKKIESSENQLKQVEQQIKTLKTKLDRTDDLYIDGKLTPDRYEAKSSRYRKELAKLESEVDNLREMETSYHKYLKIGFEVASNLFLLALIQRSCPCGSWSVIYDNGGKQKNALFYAHFS